LLKKADIIPCFSVICAFTVVDGFPVVISINDNRAHFCKKIASGAILSINLQGMRRIRESSGIDTGRLKLSGSTTGGIAKAINKLKI
jgi:hypothetical protein